jgi:hypothetical protein
MPSRLLHAFINTNPRSPSLTVTVAPSGMLPRKRISASGPCKIALDGAFQWPCTIYRIIADAPQPCFGFVGQGQSDFAIDEVSFSWQTTFMSGGPYV